MQRITPLFLMMGLVLGSYAHAHDCDSCDDGHSHGHRHNHDACEEALDPQTLSGRLKISSESLIAKIESHGLFGRKPKQREKEVSHLRKDLEGVYRVVSQRAERDPGFKEYIETWIGFQQAWTNRINDFESLPADQKLQLRAYLELPLSLGLKHLVAFVESPSHQKWDRVRLMYLLKQSWWMDASVDTKTSLSLFYREVLHFASAWEFVNCQY